MPVDWFFDLRFLEFFEFVPKCVMLLFPVKLPLKLCASWVISKGCQNKGDYILDLPGIVEFAEMFEKN